jgi:hypothetical protein
MRNKKGQFFIMSVVLVAIAIFILISYFISIDQSSIALFESSTKTDLKNIVNACGKGTGSGGCDPTWKDENFVKRKNVTIGVPGVPGHILIGWSGATAEQCANETRMYLNNQGEPIAIDYYMDGIISGGDCVLIPKGAVFPEEIYWIYYDSPGGTENHDYQVQAIPLDTYSLDSEEAYATCNSGTTYTNMCPHLEQVYSGKFKFNCSTSGSGPYTYSIIVKSKDLYFTGTIEN